MEITDFREQFAETALREIYDYWDSLRAGRHMPARKDVDPVRIPRHLPNLMLIDVFHKPLRFRYRLVGSRIVAASAQDRTGQYFADVSFFKKHPGVLEQYEAVVADAKPHYSQEPFRNFLNDVTYQAKRLILPLGTDGELVDMLMVFFYFTTGPYANR